MLPFLNKWIKSLFTGSTNFYYSGYAEADSQAKFLLEPVTTKAVVGETIVLQCQIEGIPQAEQSTSVQWAQNNFGLGYPPLRNTR